MPERSVLIVEDEAITALHLEQELKRLGYRVSGSVKDGEEAIQIAEQLCPDVILVDVELAGTMNGVEAAQRIRQQRNVPIIYITAYPRVFLEEPARMQHPGICISKPFSRQALASALKIAFNESETALPVAESPPH